MAQPLELSGGCWMPDLHRNCERVALNLKVDAEYFGNVVPHAKCSLSFFS